MASVSYDELQRVSALLIEAADDRDKAVKARKFVGTLTQHTLETWAMRWVANYLDDLYLAAPK